jgi:hypothetical protein
MSNGSIHRLTSIAVSIVYLAFEPLSNRLLWYSQHSSRETPCPTRTNNAPPFQARSRMLSSTRCQSTCTRHAKTIRTCSSVIRRLVDVDVFQDTGLLQQSRGPRGNRSEQDNSLKLVRAEGQRVVCIQEGQTEQFVEHGVLGAVVPWKICGNVMVNEISCPCGVDDQRDIRISGTIIARCYGVQFSMERVQHRLGQDCEHWGCNQLRDPLEQTTTVP